MSDKLTAAAVIPARYDSKRLPGKLIIKDPSGKYLIEYVCDAAERAERIEKVIVATDDKRIYEIVNEIGREAIMTGDQHRTGSDRIAEAAENLNFDVIVNIQADEPQMRPEMIDKVVDLLDHDPECVISTLACQIDSREELESPNVVKVVLDNNGRALYFSRLPIPYVRGASDQLGQSPAPYLHHIGIYAYRREYLLKYAQTPQSSIESAEKLEQLRALSAGWRIKVGLTPHKLIGIDTPEDFDAFCQYVSARMSEKK